MLEKRAQETTVEIGSIARSANGDAGRPASDLRVTNGPQPGRRREQRTGLAEAGEKIATVASHLNSRGAKSLNARRQLSHSCAVPGDSK